MKKFNRLDEATTPDGTVMTLFEHDGSYAIRVGGIELMSTRRHHSEDRLAELVCEPLRDVVGARVLIGGLGLGFTLGAALRILPSDAAVVVAEIVAKVIEWNRNSAYPLAAASLADPRVDLRHADVAAVLAESEGSFDAIMLDVDNGAEAFTTGGNARLYRDDGIRTALGALRPSGRIAYWSAERDPGFERALRRAGANVEAVEERVYASSSRRHSLFIAQRRG